MIETFKVQRISDEINYYENMILSSHEITLKACAQIRRCPRIQKLTQPRET
jgi:hypothetical protein